MTNHSLNINEILIKIKKTLGAAGLVMEMFVDFIIISELWIEDSKVYIIAQIPDISEQGRIVFTNKKIVYDIEADQIVEVRELKH